MPWSFQGQLIQDLKIVHFRVADKSVYFNVEISV